MNRLVLVPALQGLLLSVMALSPAAAQSGTQPAPAAPTAPSITIRNSIVRQWFTDQNERRAQNSTTTDEKSVFSLGSFGGLLHSLDDPSTFKVQNGVVVYDEERSTNRPATYLLPSVAIWGDAGKSASFIAPFSVSNEFDYGIGGSFGFNVLKNSAGIKTAEVGFSVVFVWEDIVRLSSQQLTSFNNNTPLPSGASTDFRTAKRMSIAVGIYLMPLFK